MMADLILEQPITTERMTPEAFDVYAEQPENADRRLELITGEVLEVLSNPYSSEVVMNIGFLIKLFLREKNIPGHVTGEAGGYRVYSDRYAPDVGYISHARQAHLDRRGYNTIPPELAVEVDYPSTRQSRGILTRKLASYLAAGTTVWLVFPEDQTVEIYRPGKNAIVLDITGIIDGGDILPGFTCPVADIFPPAPPVPEP